MNFPGLIQEFARTLGISHELSESGTCGVLLDQDEIMFELQENRLFIMADIGPCGGREDVAQRLLSAANFGLETGFSCAERDDERGQFTLCRILEGDLEYQDFEKIVTLFVNVVRYWKKWITMPKQEEISEENSGPAIKDFSILA